MKVFRFHQIHFPLPLSICLHKSHNLVSPVRYSGFRFGNYVKRITEILWKLNWDGGKISDFVIAAQVSP